VTLFRLLKELKKRLRIKKRWLALGAWTLMIGLGAAAGWMGSASVTDQGFARTAPGSTVEVLGQNVSGEAGDAEPQAEVIRRIKNSHGRHHTVWIKQYVCGQEEQQLGARNSHEILQFLEEHPQAVVSMSDDGTVTLTERFEDLSPECKERAYFGVDGDGNFSLFDGEPQDQQVIQTFFQLNIRYLESSLPPETVEQLRKGIRITDLAEYNSVLSTFSDYAVEETEKAMKAQ